MNLSQLSQLFMFYLILRLIKKRIFLAVTAVTSIGGD